MNNNRLSLDVIDVAGPCAQPWEAMAGDDRVRYCEGCRKHVHNLSAMTRGEAERLVCEAAGRLCVRFERAEDGRVRTLDYRAPVRKSRGWKFWTVVSACAASLVAGVNAYFLGRPAPLSTVGSLAPPPAVFTGQPPTRAVLGMMLMPATRPAAAPPAGSAAGTDAAESPAAPSGGDAPPRDLL